MSKKIDDFVGRKFGAKEQLTVLEWDGERRNGAKYYKVKCDICCADTELFGDAIFGSYKASLCNGQIPCGCGKGRTWSKQQLVILSQRACSNLGHLFRELVGDFKGVFTRISQKCTRCNHEWDSCTVNNIRQGGGGCPECIRNAMVKPDEVMVKSFMESGVYKEGTLFWRSQTVRWGWEYSCPSCSNDEYVKNGLCSGVFKSSSASLQNGTLACRCSAKFSWNRKQREYQIRKIINQESLSVAFVGWKDGYHGNTSKMILDCSHHGVWEVNTNSFVDRGSRCPDCAESGYRKSKPGNLYVMVSGDITKVGITNRSVESRLSDINWRLPKSIEEPFKVLFHEHFTDGSIPRNIETSLKKMLNATYKPMTDKFDGYTECFFNVDRARLLDLLHEEKLAA